MRDQDHQDTDIEEDKRVTGRDTGDRQQSAAQSEGEGESEKRQTETD